MQVRWQNPEYNERVGHSISVALGAPESRQHRSELTTAQWQDPVFREEQCRIHLALWQDEEFRTKTVSAATVAARTPRRRERQSEIGRTLWADPNSKYNSKEFQENRFKTGFGRRCYASDGHWCDSLFELAFEEWLISHGLEHKPHPRISNNNGKRADQLVNGYYIEIDGMNRGQEYWGEKYKDIEITPIIITNEKSFNDQLLSILTGEK